jgi:hypothetical protein
MQIHHITPQAENGPGSYENGIPLCLDCHAEVESRSPLGRSFTPAELREHRNRWFRLVQERPEVLMATRQAQEQTGPLEALLAEIEFNQVAAGGPPDEGWPPLADAQLQRAIATNAVAALPDATRRAVFDVYTLVKRINYHFEELARMDRSGGSGGAFAATTQVRNQLRETLARHLPTTLDALKAALAPDASER